MRHIAAYLLLQIGGNASPNSNDIKKLLATVGIEADDSRVDTLISELKGKDINELIAEGSSKLASVCFTFKYIVFSSHHTGPIRRGCICGSCSFWWRCCCCLRCSCCCQRRREEGRGQGRRVGRGHGLWLVRLKFVLRLCTCRTFGSRANKRAMSASEFVSWSHPPTYLYYNGSNLCCLRSWSTCKHCIGCSIVEFVKKLGRH